MTRRVVASMALALAAMFAASASALQVHRCVDSRNVVEYRDEPCDGGAGELIDIEPNTVREIDQRAALAAEAALAARVARRSESYSRDIMPQPEYATPENAGPDYAYGLAYLPHRHRVAHRRGPGPSQQARPRVIVTRHHK